MRDWRRDRFMWGRCIRKDQARTLSAKMLAWALAEEFADNDTGACHPCVETLAEALALSTRQVRRAVRELEEAGWLAVDRASGRGRSSTYQLTFPGEIAAEKAPGKGDRVVTLRPAKRVTHATGKGDRDVTPYIREPTKNPLRARTAKPSKPSHEAPPGRGRAIPEEFVACPKRLAAWSDWLARKGWPSLDVMGLRGLRRGEPGASLPFGWPPSDREAEDVVTAEAFFALKAGQDRAPRADEARRRA
ncbi:helix-turn-helix domain-containing protein [uncultured Albimonas sp.]|uniref:helix-turn-helix domain-containing protein n=1 Tax=uncultured Albimonas sp. TaxID=1331701 RepID=UPI0030EEDDED